MRDEKAVKTAIRRIHDGEYVIVRRPEGYFESQQKEEEIVETRNIDFKQFFKSDEPDEDDTEFESENETEEF